MWAQFGNAIKKPGNPPEILGFSQNGQPVEIVLATAAAAELFCGWLRTSGIKAGFLTEDHEVTPLREMTFENPGLGERARNEELRPFRVMVRRIAYGRLQVASDPPGAEVYVNGQSVGFAGEPLVIPNVKPGPVDLLLVLEGYKPLAKKLTLGEGLTIEEKLTLEKNQGVVFGRAWENGIHMRFVPVGADLMASIWETRVRDYDLFVKETGHAPARPAHFEQHPDHPVVNVSREDARAFCEWLSQRERKAERISQNHTYRLPTDLEWSRMAGLEEEEGISPNWRDARKQRVFPWGPAWNTDGKAGNFADMAAARTPGVERERTITGYDDGHAFTAPVGRFPANALGIFDLSGNVQEWVDDEFSKLGNDDLGVLRGGGWNTYQIENLFTGSRNAVPPTYQDSIYGFRVVLAKDPPRDE
jgi:hypothetical protein